MTQPTGLLDDHLHWYKDAIIYELHIKAFRDGNGDGIGDFQGIMEKLDYLEDLGVTAIWLLPFYPSPLRDDGYDIADYYTINSSYGDIDQLKAFLDEAHNRNLKVIIELVINHTSDQHPWFQRARQAPKGSPEREFYVWTDDSSQYKDVRIIFQDFETSNWTWDPVAQQHYWHRFFHHQPDLNYDSLLVQQEVMKILDYWCSMGVDGFRLDAVPYLFEREGTNGENLPETHDFLKKLRKHVDMNYPGTVLLAEANMWPEDSASYFGDGDECHMNYHFPVMPRMFMALQMEDRYPITDIFDQTPDIHPTCQWAMFLRNHDELTLEMVTDEERDYMYKAYAKDPKARINLGIRHRLAPLMDNNRRKIELMNCLLFSLNGTPVIYYGDEIGMGDNFYLGDRDGVRTPMQWSPDRNAGFSESNPHQLYLPIILDPEYHYESVNVETQRRNTSSLLWFMKRMITMRKKYRAFGRGDMKFVSVNNSKILAFTRTYEDETILVVVNLSRYSQPAELDLSEFKGYLPVDVFSKNRFPVIREEGSYFFTLGSHGYQWFVLEKAHPEVSDTHQLPEFKLNSWESILHKNALKTLENKILNQYLVQTGWFIGKERSMVSLEIVQHAEIAVSDKKVFLLLLEVQYESGLPELYQLPLAFVKGDSSRRISENCPPAIICSLKIGEDEGMLVDAYYTTEMHRLMWSHFKNEESLKAKGSTLLFSGTPTETADETDELKVRLHATGHELIITYNNAFALKLYRRVERTTNPDVELSRMLSEEAHFECMLPYVARMDWKIGKEQITLGMLQSTVENHGEGWKFMVEQLNNYYERILSLEPERWPDVSSLRNIFNPLTYEEIPDTFKDLLGGSVVQAAQQLGVRTGEMHRALASSKSEYFTPEEFSLHYQRSLYSGLQALVRETFQNQSQNLDRLPEELRPEAQGLLARRQEVLTLLKRIYRKKLDVVKIRIHGNYQLEQVLFTGKDLAICNFGGSPERSFSERRLKRSPLRDVAGMIHSFNYAAYAGLLLNNQIRPEDIARLTPFAEMWIQQVSGLFMESYLKTVEGSAFIPKQEEDLSMLLQTFLLEKALSDLNQELTSRPDWVMVSLRVILSMLSETTVEELT
ncbi:maltose alpha-D-glucosyltransferase [Arundinibacter roseus]|uniref:maltose alpha-D-glucosyltransferase n=1 Tax=Arundinibacter roseus TaxID=2070510 RepID=A0A4R4JWD7_9BACT|nr:maltose alpha-D-glucosyltransferase [Arundinibacter roseus]TDB59147.1 maltose alpha-D-glucosyltransferase [Arundinibacter roseus]